MDGYERFGHRQSDLVESNTEYQNFATNHKDVFPDLKVNQFGLNRGITRSAQTPMQIL